MDRHRVAYINDIIQDRHTFCPAFQYFLATTATYYGFTRMYAAAEKKNLKDVLERGYLFGADLTKDYFLRRNCHAYQSVVFNNGRMHVIDENNVEDRMGFERPDREMLGKRALTRVIPSFGAANFGKVLGMLNSAFSNPGEYYGGDMVVWDSHLRLSTVRIIFLVEFRTLGIINLMVGWVN